MPTFRNASPVVLDVDGRMVAPDGEATCKASHPAVRRGHLVPTDTPEPTDIPDSEE